MISESLFRQFKRQECVFGRTVTKQFGDEILNGWTTPKETQKHQPEDYDQQNDQSHEMRRNKP